MNAPKGAKRTADVRNGVAFLEGFQQVVQIFLALAFQQRTPRNHDVPAPVFNPDDQELHAAPHQGVGVARGSVHLAAGTESRLAQHFHRVTALTNGGHPAVHRQGGVAGLFQRGHPAAAHGAGQADFLRGDSNDPGFHAVARSRAFLALGIQNVLALHDAVHLDAHIHKDAVAGDGNDGAADLLARLQTAGRSAVRRQHGGEIFSGFFLRGAFYFFLSHISCSSKLGILLSW